MPSYIQAELTLPIDNAPNLYVLHVDGTERIGEPYDFQVTLCALTDTSIDVDSTIGELATLALKRVNTDGTLTEVRTIRGLVTDVEDSIEGSGVSRVYKVRIRPPVALLDRISGQEIFVGAPIPEVIRGKLTHGALALALDIRLQDPATYLDDATAAEWKDAPATGHPAEPRLVAQYKESDLAFVMRLAEHVGLSMFFEEHEDGDRVVFTDNNGGFTQADATIPYRSGEATHGIVALSKKTQWIPTTVMTCDFNYRAPTQTLTDGDGQVFDILGAREDMPEPWPGLVVEYAPNVKNAREAQHIAKVRAEELRTRSTRLVGQAELPTLAPGLRFKIGSHPSISEADEHVVFEARHIYDAPPPGSATDTRPPSYHLDFEAVPLKTGTAAFAVRPKVQTPKPKIHGLLTAVVVAPTSDGSAERQHIDTVGRYLIKLHFAQGDVPTMPRVRMAQSHVGAGYGIHFPLRPGAEVLVAFLDGDPDRPVIVGAVSNAIHPSPVVSTSNADDPVEANRILTRSGILIEISDGDPPS
jgi:type VI secretion system secreted protein VgrG